MHQAVLEKSVAAARQDRVTRARQQRGQLIAVITGTTGTGPSDPVTDQAAVGLLNPIATVAAAEDAAPVRDDQYVYTYVKGTQQIMDEGKHTIRRSDWHAVDGRRPGLARITVLSGPSGRGTRDMRLYADPNAMSYRELQALPTGPEALYRKIWVDTKSQGPIHAEAALEAIGRWQRSNRSGRARKTSSAPAECSPRPARGRCGAA
ncbi:hypothetical protein AB0D71_45930 [Streptomyces avermitilis]|uniref:hypothetical protein n=1 Tax=Streptomyces avermitilis TaxID=33903 RepID=UPI00340BE40A